MARRSWLARVGRGLRWAVFGRPARQGIGELTRPRRLYVEATVVSPPLFRSAGGDTVAWARPDMVEQVYGLLGRVGFELAEMRMGSERRPIEYRVVRTIVRGADLRVETAHGEALTLREGSFTMTPDARRAWKVRALPKELGGSWPGSEPDRPLMREACIRRGDLIRFEALFTPERHARSGSSYRDEVELRYRVDGGRDPIEITLVAPEDR